MFNKCAWCLCTSSRENVCTPYIIPLLIYLDELFVYSKTFESHLENLREVPERLREANLKLHPEKCTLFCREISFLGQRVSSEGISTDPGKIKSIRDWPEARNIKETRSFVGLASYYRSFSPHLLPLEAVAQTYRTKSTIYMGRCCPNCFWHHQELADLYSDSQLP